MSGRFYWLVTLFIISPLLLLSIPLQGDSTKPYSQLKNATKVSKAAADSIRVQVDWNDVIREIPKTAYGVNSAANFIPDYSNDSIFMRNLKMITQQKGFVRLHGWGMLGNSPEAWQENGVWDSPKIKQALQPLVDEAYEVIINIPSGPSGENDFQDATRFAQFCADLVKIVNIDHHLGIKYWEIPNERESGFIDQGLSVSEMAALFQKSYQAMKVVDPSIKVGGPATAWVNIDYVSSLVDELYPNIDFISVHTYSGDGSNSIPNAYDIAQFAMSDLATMKSRINNVTGNGYLPIFLTEYNISFQGSPRIQTHHGAVYDAIILTGSIRSGADASMYWNIAPYSDMSVLDGDIPNANAHLFENFNQSFHGDLVKSESSNTTKLIVYPIKHNLGTKERAFALINRSNKAQAVILDFKNWLPSDLSWTLWDKENANTTRSTSWIELNQGSFTVSAYSVNLFVSQVNQTSVNSSNSGGGVLPIHLLIVFLFLFTRVKQRFPTKIQLFILIYT